MFRVRRHLAPLRTEPRDGALALKAGQALILAVAEGSPAATQRTLDTVREVGPTLAHRHSQAWLRLLSAIDDAFAAEGGAEVALVALCMTPHRIVGASVGSAEAWWVGGEGHFDLTEAQRRTPLLGTGQAQPVPFALKRPKEGTLLVATNGLFTYAEPLAITDTVRAGLDTAPEALQKLAEGPQGQLYDELAILLASADTMRPWTRFLSRFRAD